MAKEQRPGDLLDFVPPGGLWLLGGLVVLILALAAKLFGVVPAQLALLVVGLLLAGVGVMRRLQNDGTVAGHQLTAGVLMRLLGIVGVAFLLMMAGVLLVGEKERDTALKSLTATAPGGGLPTGDPRPFPWMFYTDAVCLVLGLVLIVFVGSFLLITWAMTGKYVADESPVGDTQTSSAIMLVLGAVVALLAYLALDPAWDSGRSFLCVLSLVAIVGAMLIVLPIAWRKVIASILIVLHFGGIASAITAIDPPGAPAPWVSSKMWAIFYRPYLQFTYMNNAYHFYSPEPGPANLLWARLQYEDGGYQWIKLPSRSRSPVPLHYQRILAITESVNQIQPTFEPDLQRKDENRRKFGELLGIPIHPAFAISYQYREPGEYSKRLIASYVRHLARAHPTFEGKPLERIKLYRVTHSIINAASISQGERPTDPTLYLPYFQGEFTPDGKIVNPDDPFLYWIIPILPKLNAPGEVVNFHAVHAGDQKTP